MLSPEQVDRGLDLLERLVEVAEARERRITEAHPTPKPQAPALGPDDPPVI